MKLTKIKLINWMYFQNVSLDIKGNTMITGTNASGKSTIIDALQYVLVGNLKSVKFNTAADDVTKRTLKSYVRGFVNDDHMKYLREGDVTSHIALEIENGKSSSLIGAVIDISSSYTKTRFYFVENCMISEDLFFIENEKFKQIRTYQEYKKYISITLDKNFEEFNSVSQYQQKQRSFFGILPDKYSKLLPKAIGFKSISKVESFVNDFLLDDSRVNIEGLRSNIARLNSLQKAIEEEQNKLLKLKFITDEHENYKRYEERINLNRGLTTKVHIEQIKSSLNDREKNKRIYIGKNEDLFKKQNSLSDEITLANDTVTAIKVDINQNSSFQTLRTLKDDLSKLIVFQNQNSDYYDKLLGRINFELNIIKTIRNFDSLQFHSIYEYLKFGHFKSDGLRRALIDYDQDLKAYNKNLIDKKTVLDKEYSEFSKNINDTSSVIENLKKNRKPYPHYVNALINEINNVLFEKYQRNIIIQPISEISEIKNEDWRNAIEGYLNTQRFDLIIEPRYFIDALEIYESIKKRDNIFGIGIVDCKKIDDDIKPIENTLSEYIVSENKYARNYLYSILNKVTRVERVSELSNYQIAITKSCMTYKNNVARQINSNTFLYPFIGVKANQLLLEKKIKELAILNSQVFEIKSTLDGITIILQNLDKSSVSSLIDSDNPLISSIDIGEDLALRRNNLENEINKLGNEPTFIDLSSKLVVEEKKLVQLNLKKTEFDKEIGANEQTVKVIQSESENLNKELVEQENIFSNFIHDKNYEIQIKSLYDQYLLEKNNSFDLVIKKIENSNIQFVSQYNSSQSNLLKYMTEFNMMYNFGAEPMPSNIEKYIALKNEIEINNLMKYVNDLDDLKNKTNDIFRESFIQEIRNKIRVAKSQIENLNKILKNKNFGEHQYQLKFSNSKNAEFAEYHSVILDEYNIDYDLFNDVLVSKNKAIINRLFHKLTMLDEDKYAIDLLDYRKYIDVDIEIKSSTGKKLLSDVKHTQSGGESQVPFYIVAAASFQQLLIRNREKESNLCIVLFDEAFNNMDSQRVSSMMKFYNELNIQIFLSLTGEKLHSIAKYVDSTIVIIRDGLVADVMPFEGDYND